MQLMVRGLADVGFEPLTFKLLVMNFYHYAIALPIIIGFMNLSKATTISDIIQFKALKVTRSSRGNLVKLRFELATL